MDTVNLTTLHTFLKESIELVNETIIKGIIVNDKINCQPGDINLYIYEYYLMNLRLLKIHFSRFFTTESIRLFINFDADPFPEINVGENVVIKKLTFGFIDRYHNREGTNRLEILVPVGTSFFASENFMVLPPGTFKIFQREAQNYVLKTVNFDNNF